VARENSLKKTLGELESQMAALQKAALSDTTGDAIKSSKETRVRLLDAQAEWSVLQREIAAKYPVTEGQAFQLDRVQKALTGETALLGWLNVEMGIGEPESWGYVIRDSGAVNWVRFARPPQTPDDKSPAKRTRQFRDALNVAASWQERVTDVHEINSCAMEVWTEWVSPLVPYLDGVKNLVVIPSDPMLGIPVEALMDTEGVYLGESYAVSYTPSATIYTWLHERQYRSKAPAVRTALLLGDPPFTSGHLAAMERQDEAEEVVLLAQFTGETMAHRDALAGNEDALSRLPRLPYTRKEVVKIASVLKEKTVLLGPGASEQELKKLAESGALREFDMIHLATHTLVDDQAPERSALILSRADLPDPLEAAKTGKRIYDGLLTAKEIVREWKLDAELVTLSGCQTGLGREVAGEGYIGLAHAFLQAGARSLVVSLWRVEDEAACLLMERFYENLTGIYKDERANLRGKAMSKTEALREAKRWLRTYTDGEGRQPFRHPVYWSGFVLIGEPG
jgi:CHAT domain-containing protein